MTVLFFGLMIDEEMAEPRDCMSLDSFLPEALSPGGEGRDEVLKSEQQDCEGRGVRDSCLKAAHLSGGNGVETWC